MKIYDKKLFYEAILEFVVSILLLCILHMLKGINVAQLTIYVMYLLKMLSYIRISLSEEKSREERLRRQLTRQARHNLYGSKLKYMYGAQLTVIVLGLWIFRYMPLLSVIIISVVVLHLIWCSGSIVGEAKRMKEEIKTTENRNNH